jgi:Mrp family chromosome partitioning ATPase/capsular polysaccharide biosynthesis protein
MSERIDTGELERRTGARRSAAAEEPIEVRRYLDALRRSLRLIVAITFVLAVTVYVVSSSLPKRYKATASIVQRTGAVVDQTGNVDSITRDLNTINSLVTTDSVLGSVARKVPGATIDDLRDNVSSSVDPNANLIYVTAKDGDAEKSADIANSVARTFVSEQASIQRRQYQQARAELQDELARLEATGDARAQERAIRDRISQLAVSIATAGIDLAVAQPADVPDAQDTPRPLRNTALGIVLGLFVGVLVALGRDQLVPRISGSRELSRLLELPVLVTVPYVPRRGRRARVLSGIEYETYQTLATSVRFSLPPGDGPHVVLVTSALHAEGKSTVTMRLGRALAQAGHRTLLVSADMRWPTLHDLVEVPLEPGLADLLQDLPDAPPTQDARTRVTEAIHTAPHQRRGTLDTLPSGRKPADPTNLLADVGLDLVFDALVELDYAYVIVDAPPLLGIADTRALARRATSLLYVARMDRITLENVVDAADVIDRMDRPGLGMVVIGVRSDASPYYLTCRVPALEDV